MLLLCLSLLISPCLSADLVDTLAGRPEVAAFLQLVKTAGLEDTLKRGTYTILAPTDAALAKIDALTLSTLLSNTTKLASVLAYHIIPGKIPTSAVTDELTAATIQGSKVRFNVLQRSFPTIITVNGKKISTFDVIADNGVIHFIDDVMMPVSKTIVELIAEDPELSTLLSLVTLAGIGFEFQESPITLFAPTNAAFAAIPAATVTKLTSDIPILQETLEFHAVADKTIFSIGIYDQEQEASLDTDGDTLDIYVREGKVIVGVNSPVSTGKSGTVVTADIQASNGVLHKIDGVLIPRRVDTYLQSP